MVIDVAATASVTLDAIEHRRMIRLLYLVEIAFWSRTITESSTAPSNCWLTRVGGSSSRPLPNWILMKANEITDPGLLDQTFPGGRPTASGEHLKWDTLFIRVKPATDHPHAGLA